MSVVVVDFKEEDCDEDFGPFGMNEICVRQAGKRTVALLRILIALLGVLTRRSVQRVSRGQIFESAEVPIEEG